VGRRDKGARHRGATRKGFAFQVSAVSSGVANAGTGTLAVSGSPRNEYDVCVDIVSGGSLNEGTFRVNVDGSAGKVTTIPDGTGLTLQFTPGESGFAAGDSFGRAARQLSEARYYGRNSKGTSP
jgi:hypothetical protein